MGCVYKRGVAGVEMSKVELCMGIYEEPKAHAAVDFTRRAHLFDHFLVRLIDGWVNHSIHIACFSIALILRPTKQTTS